MNAATKSCFVLCDDGSLGDKPKLFEKGWAPQPAAVNKSINLGTTNAQIIDLSLKRQSCDVISPINCLTCPKKVAES